MIRYSPEEIALFIFSCADLSDESEAEIEQALEDWREHMLAGGFEIGVEVKPETTHSADTQSDEI